MPAFQNWTASDLKNWVNTVVTLNGTAKNAIIQGINDFVDGKLILDCENADDLVQALGVSKLTASQLMKALKNCAEYNAALSSNSNEGKTQDVEQEQKKQQEQQQKAISMFNESNMNNEESRNQQRTDEFYPTLKLNVGGLIKETRNKISPNMLVKDFRDWLIRMHLSNNGKISKITLTCSGKVMADDNVSIKTYGCVSSYNMIAVAFRVIGGAQLPKTQKIRKMDINNPLIKLTKKADTITYEDSEDEPRALMPCGHAFTAITMFTYIEHCFGNDFKFTDFVCPVKNCLKPWDWGLVASVGDLSMDEFEKFSNLIEKRQLLTGEVKACPHCAKLLDKPENLNQNRVRCIHCNGSDFCYLCLKSWNHSGLQICGSYSCETKVIEDNIKNCEDVTITGTNQVVPRIRACPKCLTIITYEHACKHMTCPRKDCKHEFCFSCLGKWPCPSSYQPCQPASRQQL